MPAASAHSSNVFWLTTRTSTGFSGDAVLAALPGLEEERARLYFDLVGGSLNEAAREAIYEVLEARGIQLSPEHRQRIAGCEDLEQLKVWHRLAVTATSVEQLLTAAPKPPGPPAR